MSPPAPLPGHKHLPPFDSGFLKVGTLHNIHYAQYGNKAGKTVLYLHGGPGAGCNPSNTIYFNPLHYRVVLLDQRGAGLSTPNAETRENTSQDLVSDLETLRAHLQIDRWAMVFGGSWGSTLALLYAQAHPGAVGYLVLRGIFTVRRCELEWTNVSITPRVFPAEHARFAGFIAEAERGDVVGAYMKRIAGGDEKVRRDALYEWSLYEISVSSLRFDPESLRILEDPKYLVAHSTLEIHYFLNRGFIEDGQLLRKENIDRMRHIPGVIVQGRYDMVCHAQTAYELHEAWPESEIHYIADAGHSAKEPGTHQKLLEVCDAFAST